MNIYKKDFEKQWGKSLVSLFEEKLKKVLSR
jgi:hypothetical protein